jgi:uncharacterized OB-fold protein
MTEHVNRPGGMPSPVVAPLNEGMWRAAAGGRLAVHRCRDCGAHRYPPGDGCYRCASVRWDWDTLPGSGSIYSYIWIPDRARNAAASAAAAEASSETASYETAYYNVAVVTLDGTEGEPVRLLSNVVDAWRLEDLRVGQRVEVVGVPFADDLALPCFRMVP